MQTKSPRFPALALLVLACVASGGALAVEAPAVGQEPAPVPIALASADDNMRSAAAAVVVAALSEQFGNAEVSVQLQTAQVEGSGPRDRVVSGAGRMSIGGAVGDDDWLAFSYRTRYDTLFGSAGYPELTLGGDADGERLVPNDASLVSELDDRLAAELEAEHGGERVRLQLDRISTIEAGRRFLRIDAVGIADFGPAGTTTAHVDALYDRRDNAWLRVSHELGTGATVRDDEPIAGN